MDDPPRTIRRRLEQVKSGPEKGQARREGEKTDSTRPERDQGRVARGRQKEQVGPKSHARIEELCGTRTKDHDGGFLIPPKPLVRRCLSLPLLSLPSSYFPSTLALSSYPSTVLSPVSSRRPGAPTKQDLREKERGRTASARRRH